MHQHGCHQSLFTEKKTVEFMVHGESDVTWTEDGVDHRARSNTGSWDTAEEAQAVVDQWLALQGDGGWTYFVVKVTTTETIATEEV